MSEDAIYYKGVEVGKLSKLVLVEAFVFLAKRTLRLEAEARRLKDENFMAECLELSKLLEIKDE